MIWLILTISFFILTLLLTFFCYNLYNQVIQLEVALKQQVKKETDIDKFYAYLLGLLTHAYADIQRIDKRGSFSADDEVGFAFKVIYRAIEETKAKIESLRVVTDQDESQGQNKK